VHTSIIIGETVDFDVERKPDMPHLKCSRCQAEMPEGSFDIDAMATVRVTKDECQLEGELVAYPANTTVHCLGCGNSGDMRQFLGD
jgi:ferritin-like protein